MLSTLKLTRFEVGMFLLRMGLATVFLWFGFSQIFNGPAWVGLVPEYVVNIFHVSPAFVVMMNGVVEIALGSLLAMGLGVRIVALLLAIHLVPITFEMGFTEVGIRDFGLALATFALVFLYNYKPEPPTLE